MKYYVLVVACLLFSACMPPRPDGSQTDMWLSQLRGMTLEEALQRLGPARQCQTVEATTVCIWQRGEPSTRTVHFAGTAWAPGESFTEVIPPGTARLTFMDGQLTSWVLDGPWK
jgi:hypothetical protein